MKTLFFFIVIVAAIGWGLRMLRKREVDAFLDADMVDFHSFEQAHEVEEKPDPALARAEAFIAMNPGIVEKVEDENDPGKTVGEDGADSIVFTDGPDPTLYRARSSVFDEVTANMLQHLARIIPSTMMVLNNVPLSEFATTDDLTGGQMRLANNRVAYLIIDKSEMSVVCGMQLRDAGATHQGKDIVKTVFGDIGIPLLEFPVKNDISELEIRDQLDPLIAAIDARDCPKCGESMSVKKAQKGKRAGEKFWVCNRFPECRGAIQI